MDKASGLPAGIEPARRPDPRRVPDRPAWIEVNLGQLRENFRIIRAHNPNRCTLLLVVKDEAYGHGAVRAAQTALEEGVAFLAVATLQEALALRDQQIDAPILLLGERHPEELPSCVEHDLRCSVSQVQTVTELGRLGRLMRRPVRVHVKVDTGMSRYGVRWTEAGALLQTIQDLEWVELEGIYSHFSMSDETDKTFALLQLQRFREVLAWMDQEGFSVRYRHLCNSGGFLDLPQAHYDMVRIGLLALGVYPSQVCRRLPGIAPILTLKSRVSAVQMLKPGDRVGYGMRYEADRPRRIGVLPIGYGDGFPRLRNQGCVLVHGRRAPIIGANAMDATMIDLTDIPQAQLWDETVLLGRQQSEEISVHEIARWGQTVSYDILSGWRARLPRLYCEAAS